MKTIFITIICLFSIVNTVLAQCSNIKIISAVSQKPKAPVVSLTCSQFTIKWKGQTNQSFVVTVIEKHKNYSILDTITTTSYSFDGSYYAATVNVKEGKLLYWTVEAITTINNTNYYSYGLRGENAVPDCTPNAIASTAKKDNALSVISEEKTFVKVYPNPVQSILNIEFNKLSALNKTISIYDVNGKLLLTKSATGNTQIDVGKLTAGTYLIKINDANGKVLYNGKVIKE
jgi:hypothetical protein